VATGAAKRKEWKQMEIANARHTLAKVKPMLLQLGFRALKPSQYRMDINGKTCNLGITKLSRTPKFRILASIEGDKTDLLASDPYERKGHPSGQKFVFDVSRFRDNSAECAQQIAAFSNAIALPWFRDRVDHA
jgi:hypothetical protein